MFFIDLKIQCKKDFFTILIEIECPSETNLAEWLVIFSCVSGWINESMNGSLPTLMDK